MSCYYHVLTFTSMMYRVIGELLVLVLVVLSSFSITYGMHTCYLLITYRCGRAASTRPLYTYAYDNDNNTNNDNTNNDTNHDNVCIYIYTHTYIYIHTIRYVCIYVSLSLYIYIYIHREIVLIHCLV